MNKIIGFIGAGNMGSAMAGGMLKNGLIDPQDIIFSDINEVSLKELKTNLNVRTTSDNLELAKNCDVIVLAVKPNTYGKVIREIKDHISFDTLVISIAAGISIKHMEESFEKNVKIVRTMPNTPALVNEGMTAIVPNKHITAEELEEILPIFESIGKIEIVEEKLIDSVIAVSGSSPAYAFMMIEAMGDAAVLEGMDRQKAYRFAAQALLGAAKMVLETDEHPGKLKDMVCSPGGTTIEAVAKLEEKGFRTAIVEAMRACAKKSKNM